LPLLAALPAFAQQTGRTQQQIFADISRAGAELQQAIGDDPSILVDNARREAAAPKVRPVLEKLDKLTSELAASGEGAGPKLVAETRNSLLRYRALFGDEKMIHELEAQSSGGGGDSTSAKLALLFARWCKSSKDAAAQEQVLNEAQQLADANPERNDLTQMLQTMGTLGAATPQLATRAEQIASSMKSGAAEQAKSQMQADRKLRSLQDKPIVIHGKTVDDKDFSSEAWKGKVILVDYWATWCGPCKAMLPKLNTIYSQQHDKGFEIVGISCDKDPNALKKYLAQSQDIHWPTLHGGNNPSTGWHPMAEEFGITNLPMYLLIDKKGTLRAFGAGEDFEALIPKLLAE
jgi:thiol-disulfide isomerase/thioredoxin